ncbi:MAG: T9SS type A sorting domain-containing protein [Bacteroidales bacterium]|nr:T9SS type A sorting domain-containing protein [Bacteroidales bacterium]
MPLKQLLRGDKGYHINNHPATRTLELSFSNEEPKNIRVFNMQGELLTEKQIAEQHVSLPLTGFAGGFYIFQAITESGTTINGTFVVAK